MKIGSLLRRIPLKSRLASIAATRPRGVHWPPKVAWVFGTCVAETILASVHVRARKQAGHMDASDLIRALPKCSCEQGAVHIWTPRAALHIWTRRRFGFRTRSEGRS